MPFLLVEFVYKKTTKKKQKTHVLCNEDNEDINHLMFHCNLARAVWLASDLTLRTSLLWLDRFHKLMVGNLVTCSGATLWTN